MEVVTEDQGPRGFEHELSQIVDATTDNQDDEFDFTIGGEDDLDPNAEDYQTHGVVSGEAGQNEVDEISVNYKAEDQEGDTNEVLALAEDEQRDDANDEMHELNDDHAGAIEYANEGDENNATEQTRSRSEEETVEQNPTEEHVEDVVEEEIYYQMAEEESEAFEDNAQPEPDHEPVDMEHATSVDYASGNEEVDNHDEARVDEDQVSGSQNVVIEIEQSAAVELREEQSQYVGGDIGGGEPSFDNDDQDNMSSKDDSVTDPVDKSQDHGIWDVEEHDDEDSDRRPQVTISYQSQDYSLFAEFPDQSPDHYFLSDLDLLHSPLSQLLASIREVISDEIATAQEVFLRVNGLGFEFAESTTKDFLDATTFAHIIEVNKQLVANEGGSPSPILECYIGLRPSCLHRFSELSKAAEEGKGLSDVAMFYDDVSANESMEEYEEHDFSQDMISDSPSLDDAAIVDNDTTGNNIDANDTEQYFNAFQPTEEPLQSIDEPNIPVVEEGEFAEQGEYSAEALSVDSTEFEGAKAFENVSGDVDDELHANNAEALDFTRDSSGHDEGVYDQSITEDAGVVDVDLNDEMRTELSQEHNGQIDGKTFILLSMRAFGTVDACFYSECLPSQCVDLDDLRSPVSMSETHTRDGVVIL